MNMELGEIRMDAPLLSIVVPMKNEEDAIAAFLARMRTVLDALNLAEGWEIVFVDDGSTDRTLALVARGAPRRSAHPRRLAVAQLRQGGGADRRARSSPPARSVVPIDVDLQDPPEVIGEMIAQVARGLRGGLRRAPQPRDRRAAQAA